MLNALKRLRGIVLLSFVATPLFASNTPTLQGPHGEPVAPAHQVMVFIDERGPLTTSSEGRRVDNLASQMWNKFPDRKVVYLYNSGDMTLQEKIKSALDPGDFITDFYLLNGARVSVENTDIGTIARLSMAGESFIHPTEALFIGDDRHYPLDKDYPWRYSLFAPFRGRFVQGAHVIASSAHQSLSQDGATPIIWADLLRASLGIRDGIIMLAEPKFTLKQQLALLAPAAATIMGSLVYTYARPINDEHLLAPLALCAAVAYGVCIGNVADPGYIFLYKNGHRTRNEEMTANDQLQIMLGNKQTCEKPLQ